MIISEGLQSRLRDKYDPDGSALRKAQLRMTEMLVFMDKICTKYHLRYWLDGGTLLGAVRHGGFIPWDDDTDMCMPIEDLHKLKKIMATEHLSDEFVLQTPENDKNYLRIEWCVLRDLKSEYVQTSSRFHGGLKYRGLQVDVFPMETKVNPSFKRCSNKFLSIFVDKFIQNEKIPYKFGLRVARISRSFMASFMIPLFRLFKDKKNKDSYVETYGVDFMDYHKIADIYPLKRVSFEGCVFNAPQNVDAYLTDLYGDWKKIPNSDEIQTHHVKIKFYDTPVGI